MPVGMNDEFKAEKVVVDCTKVSPRSISLTAPQSSRRTSLSSVNSQDRFLFCFKF
jgi:hypothetical protein